LSARLDLDMLQAIHPHRLPAQARSLADRMSDTTFECASTPGTLASDAPSVIGHQDWHTLFDAVLVQLRHTVAARADGNGDLQVRDAGRTRTRVLECVSALEKLQAARVRCDESALDAAPSPLYASKGSS
jgi:hypothetical protein